MTAETNSRRMQNRISYLERVALRMKSMIRGSRDFLKKSLHVQKCYVCVTLHPSPFTEIHPSPFTYCCFDNKSDKFKFSSKGVNKGVSGDGPMSKYRRVLDEAIILTSTIRGFRTINHMVATYEQTKKGISYFYPKRQTQDDGIHTKPLNL